MNRVLIVGLFLLVFGIAVAEEKKPVRVEPGPGQESVWDYPSPPSVEETKKQVRVIYDSIVIAETERPVRGLQTGHPPVYYIPQEDIRMEYLVPVKKTSTCEFKGVASYFNVKGKTKENANAAWSYPDPTAGYEKIRNYIAFYPRFMDSCYVDGELVRPEPGEYFGGWVTNDIVGPFQP